MNKSLMVSLISISVGCLAWAPDQGLAADSDEITAKVTPCGLNCKPPYEGTLVVNMRLQGQSAEVSVPTTMNHTSSAMVSDDGRVIVVGEVAPAVSVISVIDMRKQEPLVEFWSMNWSVSPNRRFIAFSPFLGLHFQQSLYMDAIVYVLDVKAAKQLRPTFQRVPESAVAIYPPEVMSEGRQALEKIDPMDLLHVISSNVRWGSDDSISFFVAALEGTRRTDANAVYHVIARPDVAVEGLLQRAVERSAPLPCGLAKLGDRDYDSIATACGVR